MLEAALAGAGADKDAELVQEAEQVLAAVEEHSPEAAAGIGQPADRAMAGQGSGLNRGPDRRLGASAVGADPVAALVF